MRILSFIRRALQWVVLLLIAMLISDMLVEGERPFRETSSQPTVGIIHVEGEIWSGSVEHVRDQIEEAREDSTIKAVVVQLNSGGGGVVASQSLFLELQNLRQDMPVVGSIDSMAASGAYYTAVATDPIYAKPSSNIGNVGVWGFVPPETSISDAILASGPFKLSGSNRDEFLRSIEEIKQEFLATVFSQRGERLELSSAELSQGLLYTGREALRLGLIDQMGSRTEAIAEAAEQAGLTDYEVMDLEARLREREGDERGNEAFPSRTGAEQSRCEEHLGEEARPGAVDPVTGERNLPYGIYLLYDIRLRGAP